MNRDLGDFQTPPALVAAVLRRLRASGLCWERAFEPTVGRGHFLAGLLAQEPPPREIVGVEVQELHLAEARRVERGGARVHLVRASLFDLDLGRDLRWETTGPLLVVGNPPWVTNSALGALGSANLPLKANGKRARGIDALTGSSNFDLAEAVWLKLLTELAAERPAVALLCKTLVARNVLDEAARLGLPVADAWLARIDARRWFGATVDACLFCLTLGPASPKPAFPTRVPVFADLDATAPASALGFARGKVVADLDAYAPFAPFDGPCPLTWRQGLKHDAADLMELKPDPAVAGALRNKQGDAVEVEAEHVFPLLKGADLARPDAPFPRRSVLVTQRRPGESTAPLERTSPRLWAYLRGNAGRLAARKSSIYRGGPEFAMFGVGPYSFAPYKVAVSGLHPKPVFRPVGPVGGRPVMLDDTCYFIAARSAEQAALVSALLNGPEALGLLRALAFPGSKRPVNKGLLQRLDLAALFGRADVPALLLRAEGDAARLAGRLPSWPQPLDRLLDPEDPAAEPPAPVECFASWPSPPSIISATH